MNGGLNEKLRDKLSTFLSEYENFDNTTGVLVCGSYITGNPSNHSDLDVHIILNENTMYGERGNRLIDDLLIGYFANPATQIIKYFEDDLSKNKLMSQTQFATGEIIFDKDGDVVKLKNKAIKMIDEFYENKRNMVMSEKSKYRL